MNPGRRRAPDHKKLPGSSAGRRSYRKWPRLDRTRLSSAETPHTARTLLLLLTHDPASGKCCAKGDTEASVFSLSRERAEVRCTE